VPPRYRFLYAFAVQLPLEPPIRPIRTLGRSSAWLCLDINLSRRGSGSGGNLR